MTPRAVAIHAISRFKLLCLTELSYSHIQRFALMQVSRASTEPLLSSSSPHLRNREAARLEVRPIICVILRSTAVSCWSRFGAYLGKREAIASF